MKFIEPVAVSDSTFTSSTATEADYAVWAAGTAYTLGQRCIRTTGVHKIFERKVAGTTATAPESDSTNWITVGPTNRWAMFDQAVGTATSQATPLTVVVTPGVVVDSLALLDLQATSVRVQMTASAVSVFDTTYTLGDAAEVLDWYAYFFEPISRQSTLIVSNLPPYLSGVITVTINNTTTSVCGTMVVGKLVDVGATRYGAGVGIIDYSAKTTDSFGTTTVTKRSYAKRSELQLMLANQKVDLVAKKLATIRATPVIWIGDDTGEYSSLLIYGYYKDWGINISYQTISECSLTVEGLI